MKLSRLGKRLLPLVVSLGLLSFMVLQVSPEKLSSAAAELPWRLLLPVTACMVLALYLWDAVCLSTVYQIDKGRWSYARSLHLRGISYLFGALNYELGQASLAWGAAKAQKTGVVRMLSRSVLLAYHDIIVLLSMGLFGSMLTDDPRVVRLRLYVAIGLAVALSVALLGWALPAKVRAKFRRADSEAWFEGWSLQRSMKLVSLRVLYFCILVIYATVALAICQMPVDGQVVLSTIPLVLLADGLPSISGLGTRETTLTLLLDPKNPAALVALSLIWSSGLILGRLSIGLAHYWGQCWKGKGEA